MRADERNGCSQPVRCGRCGAGVQVVKFSPQHTSVQWTVSAVADCVELRDFARAGGAPGEGCGALRESIDAAVAAGRLLVRPPSYAGSDDSAA